MAREGCASAKPQLPEVRCCRLQTRWWCSGKQNTESPMSPAFSLGSDSIQEHGSSITHSASARRKRGPVARNLMLWCTKPTYHSSHKQTQQQQRRQQQQQQAAVQPTFRMGVTAQQQQQRSRPCYRLWPLPRQQGLAGPTVQHTAGCWSNTCTQPLLTNSISTSKTGA